MSGQIRAPLRFVDTERNFAGVLRGHTGKMPTLWRGCRRVAAGRFVRLVRAHRPSRAGGTVPVQSSMLHPSPELRARLSKVPLVTAYFWIIKVLCTTVGETFADWVNGRLGDSLTKTSIVFGFVLVIALVIQFRVPEYIPGV